MMNTSSLSLNSRFVRPVRKSTRFDSTSNVSVYIETKTFQNQDLPATALKTPEEKRSTITFLIMYCCPILQTG